jgi:hypothetical protein
MTYVIVAIVVILLVAGFVTFLTLNATNKGDPNMEGDDGPPGVGPDETPLGDTSQHAGHQTEAGTTTGGQDADEKGGTGEPVHSGYDGTSQPGSPAREDDADASAHVARPGEGEGAEHLEFEGREPERARTRDAG